MLAASAALTTASTGTSHSREIFSFSESLMGSSLRQTMASGWMQIRGTRRRRSMDAGFILSDHVDWPDLMQTIHETEAENIWVTHGYSDVVVRYLREQGFNAKVVETEFTGEQLEGDTEPAS